MRSLLWYDWPFILRHRRQLKSLDNILAITHGAPLSWLQLLSTLRPSEQVFTGVLDPGDGLDRLIGQIHQSQHFLNANISYLLQTANSNYDDLIGLLDGLTEQAGYWGAKQVLADLDTDSPWFPIFRRASFSILSKERVYRCTDLDCFKSNHTGRWQIWSGDDIPAIRSLYLTLVPPLIQTVEPMTRRAMLGLVHYDQKGNLQAYADLVYGPKGAWVLPIIHPQIKDNITDVLAQMILALPGLNSRPVYITARSYQPWLEHALDDLALEPGPEQTLLIRYLALRQRVKSELSFSSIENGKPEPTMPILPLTQQRD